MKVVYEYSHLGGSEILKVRFPEQDGRDREQSGRVIPPQAPVG